MLFSIVIPARNEEENIGKLIRSIFDQSYRPIEVILVDDGSDDDTLNIAGDLKRELSGKDFTINIFETGKDTPFKGTWAAKNLGIIEAKGEYILISDADFQFIKKDTLTKIEKGLADNQVVSFYLTPIIDNKLENNLVLDFNPKERPFYCAYQSEVIKKVPPDPKIGSGGDWDLSKRLKESGLIKKQMIIEVEVGVHWPHTYSEYLSQRFWRGRTAWLIVKKYPTANVLFKRILFPISTFGLFFLSIVSLLIDLRLTMLFTSIFLLLTLSLFLRSPVKTVDRLLHMIVVRFILGSFVWFVAAVYGFYQFVIRGS